MVEMGEQFSGLCRRHMGRLLWSVNASSLVGVRVVFLARNSALVGRLAAKWGIASIVLCTSFARVEK